MAEYTYSIYWGAVKDSSGKLVAVGYSGLYDRCNEPASVSEHNLGPIPPGKYTIKGPFSDSNKGPTCFDLIPDPSNKMYGRSGFMIHGDTSRRDHDASNGCIIMDKEYRELFKHEDTLVVNSI